MFARFQPLLRWESHGMPNSAIGLYLKISCFATYLAIVAVLDSSFMRETSMQITFWCFSGQREIKWRCIVFILNNIYLFACAFNFPASPFSINVEYCGLDTYFGQTGISFDFIAVPTTIQFLIHRFQDVNEISLICQPSLVSLHSWMLKVS